MTTANSSTTADQAPAPRQLRLRRANRNDVVPVPARLEDLVPEDHLARLMWDMVARLEAALAEMPAVKAAKKAADRDKARASSTDRKARVIKMPDGGYRPAYNWQFGVELSHFVITGVDVVNTGSDKAQMEPMVDHVLTRTQCLPRDWLSDGGFQAHGH